MCGIAGIYGSHLTRTSGVLVLKRMLQLILHRGPDEAGMYLSNRLYMGTVRLSIVDIASGQQPMCDELERYALCYNGEIYNYVELRDELKALGYSFSTHSDTEVVLRAWQAWGERGLKRLNGAFAFALYDSERDVLHLVRDRFGKRPLFYARHANDIMFASEMKGFLAVDDFAFEFDAQQLSSILTLWTVTGDQSGYKGIQQVPQASVVRISASGISVKRYVQLDFTSSFEIDSEAEAIEEIAHTLRHAVELRLRGDVEIGMYLSGGLDSSILASILAQQVSRPLRTYSVGFEDKEFDESADQLRIATHIGSSHQVLNVSDRMIAEGFPAAAFHAEVPVFRTALVPMYLLSRIVREDGIKVVLTGEGADEAFLGYDLFKETLLRTAWSRIDDSEKVDRLRLLYPYLKHYRDAGGAELLGLYQQFATESSPGLFSHELRIQNGLFSRRLLKTQADGLRAIRQLIEEQPFFPGLSPTEKAQWLEYHTLLPGYLLSSQGDRMALAHSVENRCPFLDPAVVELSAAVNLRFDDGSDEKYLLRKAFEPHLPRENCEKRKHPYRAPDGKAFRGAPQDYLDLLLSADELRKNELLNPTFCMRLTEKVLSSQEGAISTKENQTFVFLLSLALQHHQFVRRNVAGLTSERSIDPILSRIVDRRLPKDRSVGGCVGAFETT